MSDGRSHWAWLIGPNGEVERRIAIPDPAPWSYRLPRWTLPSTILPDQYAAYELSRFTADEYVLADFDSAHDRYIYMWTGRV